MDKVTLLVIKQQFFHQIEHCEGCEDSLGEKLDSIIDSLENDFVRGFIYGHLSATDYDDSEEKREAILEVVDWDIWKE